MVAQVKKSNVGLMARLPSPLHKKLEAAAKARNTSLNAELVDRLESTFGRGTLEEIFKVAYGKTTADFLVEAYRNNMLRLKDSHIEEIANAVRVYMKEVQKDTQQ